MKICGLFFVLMLSSCGPSRPSAFANLPREVDVVSIPQSVADAQRFRLLDQAKLTSPLIYRTPTNERIDSGEIYEVSCTGRLGGSGMCPNLELSCQGTQAEVSFDMELRRDGKISLHLGPPWENTPEDLVETRLLVKKTPEPSAARPHLSAQLVEGVVDSSSLQIRGQFRKSDSPWFNQLSTEQDQIFVAIHEAHPYYQQVLITLSLVGKIWAANSSYFANCGFSR